MTILASVHKARDEAGASSPKGRRYTIVSQIVQTPPVDEDHARRQRGFLAQAEQDLRALSSSHGARPSSCDNLSGEA